MNLEPKSSLFDHLAPWPMDSAKTCLIRARTCSRLAKLVTGRLRRVLYALKDQNLFQAITASPDDLEVRHDRNLFPGLLLIVLKDQKGVCVHTHESWIRDAHA